MGNSHSTGCRIRSFSYILLFTLNSFLLSALIPSTVQGEFSWTQVVTGLNHTVALRADGTLWAWGGNNYGQLGDGSTSNSSIPLQIGNDTWQAIAAGDYHTLAIRSDGTLWAWGWNYYGQLGTGNKNDSSLPVQIGTDSEWIAVAAGYGHSLAIKTIFGGEGSGVFTWGSNSDGELGTAGVTERLSPGLIDNSFFGGSSAIKQIAANWTSSFAIDQFSNSLWAWGSNVSGQLGLGDTAPRTSPTLVPWPSPAHPSCSTGYSGWNSVTAGYGNTLGLVNCSEGKYAYGWGDNTGGQAGDGTSGTNRLSPVPLTETTFHIYDALEMAAGQGHAHAIIGPGDNPKVYSWGMNAFGELGSGSTTAGPNPVPLQTVLPSSGAGNWTRIASYGNHAFALSDYGQLWGWGPNQQGNLGIGDFTSPQPTPQQVCSFEVQSSLIQIGAAGCVSCSLMLSEFSSNNCPWTATTGETWISQISSSSGSPETGSTIEVYFDADPNPGPGARTGLIRIAGINLLVEQEAPGLLPQKISIAPASPFDFSSVAVGNSASQIFNLSNSGAVDLLVDSIGLSGAADYSLNLNGGGTPCGSSFPRTLTSGASCTVAVTFQPSSLGSKTATLSVRSNDPVISTATVALSGTGTNGACNWLAAVNGNWSEATKWSCGHAPGTNDEAIITLAGTYTVTVNANTTVSSLTLGGSSGTQSLTVSGPLTLNNASTVGTYGALNLSGGTLAGSGTLSVSGTMNWTGYGGTMSGPGTTNIAAGGAFNIDNGGYPTTRKNLTSRTLNIAGTATIINNTDMNLSNATINNQTGALFSFPSDSALINTSGTNAFNNAGTVTKSAGTGASTISVPFTNTGTVNANSGTLSLALAGGGTSIGSFSVVSGATLQLAPSGTHTLGTGLSLTGAGTMDFYSGTVTVNCAYNVTGTTKVSGGTTTFGSGAAVSTVGSTLWVNGGTANFNNTQAWTDPTTLTIDGSSTANFHRGQALNIPTVNVFQGTLGGTDTLNVSGTLTWGRTNAAGGTMSGPGTTNIAAGAVFKIDNGGYPTTRKNLTDRTLNIAGTTIFSNNTGINLDNAIINNQTGALFSFSSDSILYNYSGTNAFNNAGTVTKNAGTGASTISVPFTNTGTVNANSGTLSLALASGGTSSGAFSVASGATLQLAANGTHTLDTGLSITGAGTVDFYSGTVTVNCAYNVTGTTKFSGGTTTFGSGAAVSTVGSTLWVNGGTANFNNTQAWTDPTTLTIDGSSTANFHRGQALNIPTVNVFQGTLGGTDTLNVSGTLTWGRTNAAGGTMSGPGTTNIAAGAVFKIDNGGYIATRKDLTDRTLNIAGTTTFINGTPINLRNSTINNQTGALFSFPNDGAYLYDYSGTNAFNNAGTVTKSAGTGATTIAVPFTNTGTVNANSGTLSFTNNFTNSASGEVQGTGTLSFTGTTFTNTGAINPATSGTPGKLTISGTLRQTSVVNADIGGTTAGTQYDQLAVSGAATLGGTLHVNLINGFTPSAGNSFKILTYGSKAGSFGVVNLPTLTGNSWNTTYNAGSLDLSVSQSTYTLTYAAGPNGTISGTSPQTISYGGSGTAVTAVPNTGYHFVSWSDGLPAATRTDTNVTANISVTANFAINTYTITASAGPGGSILPSGSIPVNHGSDQTFTITPDAGYDIVDVRVDNVSQGLIASYTFTGVTANQTIEAIFSASPKVLSAVTNAAGNIITISFDKVMADPSSKQAQFSVTANGSVLTTASVALKTDQTKFDLRLQAPVTFGQFVRITYSAGDVHSADGGVLASFTNLAVANAAHLPAGMISNQDGLGFSGSMAANPLGANITMTGYNGWPAGITNIRNYAFQGGVFDGQNLWLMPLNADRTVKIDKTSGAMIGYDSWPAGFTKGLWAFNSGAFDGQNIWMIPYNADHVVRVDKDTGAMTGYASWPAGIANIGNGAFAGGVFDSRHLWMAPYNADRVVKIDKDSGVMTGYNEWPAGFTKGNQAFVGGIFDGQNIWMIPYDADRVVKIDKDTGVMTGYASWPAGTSSLGNRAFDSGVFDGQNIWMLPYNSDSVVKIDKDTGVMTGYNSWPAGFIKGDLAFAGGAFDGQNIWMTPQFADRVVKIDKDTGAMTGYNGWPVGTASIGSLAFTGGAFDGQNIWLIPCQSDRAVKLATAAAVYNLTVNKSGSGTVTSNAPHIEINCGSSCSASYDAGTSVILTAAASTGSTFTGWSGEGCSGTGTCTVTMDADKSVTATFALNTYTVTFNAGSHGSLSGTTIQTGIPYGGSATAVTAVPDIGYSFVNWTGTGGFVTTATNPLTVTNVTANHTISATFASCSYTISPISNNFPASGGTGSVQIFTDPGCSWTAANNDPSWITVTSGTGAGNGSVSYSVASNSYDNAYYRSGSIAVGGKTHNIDQPPLLPGSPTLASPQNGATGVSLSPTTLSWNTTERALTYELHLATDSGFTENVRNVFLDGNTSTQVEFNDLSDNTHYYWRARAGNSAGAGPWSQVRNFSTAASAYSLTITTPSHGIIKSLPAGIDCTSTGAGCIGNFNQGTIVTLSAIPDPGYSFSGWSGGCSGQALTCLVTIDQARTVTALFTQGTPEVSTWAKGFDLQGPSSAIQTQDGGYLLSGHNAGMVLIKLNGTNIQTIDWQRRFGNSYDSLQSIRQTSDGGFVIGGTSPYNYQSLGVYHSFVLKISNSGALEWQKVYGTGNITLLKSIQITADGGYIVTGTNRGGTNVNHPEDILILKLDAHGEVEWSKSLSSDLDERAYTVIQTSDRGYLVGGSKNNTADTNLFYLVKLLENGMVDWQKSYEVNASDVGGNIRTLKQTSDGNYIIAGERISYGSGPDAWILKLNPSGDIIWQKNYQLNKDDYVGSIVQTTDGGYLLGGSTKPEAASSDLFVLRLNSDGDLLWNKKIDNLNNNNSNLDTLQETNDMGILVGGIFNFDPSNPFGVLKLDSNGNTCRLCIRNDFRSRRYRY